MPVILGSGPSKGLGAVKPVGKQPVGNVDLDNEALLKQQKQAAVFGTG